MISARNVSLLACALFACSVPSAEQAQDLRRLSLVETIELDASDFRLQAVSASLLDESIWVSGTGGVWIRHVPSASSSDGQAWPTRRFEEASLEFRDVEGINEHHAVLLAAGRGSASRLYLTRDGGDSWVLSWIGEDSSDEEETPFLDCIAFWDSERGFAYGDATGGRLFILRTTDGGATWKRLADAPMAQPGEGGFAASGDCVQVDAGGFAAIVTGAARSPRLLLSYDYATTWASIELPMPGGSLAGGFALAVSAQLPNRRIFVAGGTLEDGAEQGIRLAVATVDANGGLLSPGWLPLGPIPIEGALYGLAAAGPEGRETVVVVGPGGVARSTNGGQNFVLWSEQPHWSVELHDPQGNKGLIVGPGGRIARIATSVR